MSPRAAPQRNWKLIGMWMVFLLIFIAELLFYTWSRVQCVQIGYEITKQNAINRKRTTLQNNLKIELARLKSPERISKIATAQLGLVMPKSNQTIIMP
jgi:cell division protein FtsL